MSLNSTTVSSSSSSCHYGWSSVGDFSTSNDMAAQACDQNLVIIQVFGAVLALAGLIAFPLKFLFAYKRYTNEMPNKTVQLIQTTYGILSGIYDLTHVIHGLLKAIAPQTYVMGVGLNPGMDILLFFMTVSFFSLMHAVALNLSYFLAGTAKMMPKEQQDKVQKAVAFVQSYAILSPIMGLIFAIFPFLAYINTSVALPMALVFLIGYWVLIVIQGMQNIYLLTTVTTEMNRFLSGSSLGGEEALTKVRNAYNGLSKQTRITSYRLVFSIFGWIIFAVVPSLRRIFTYFYMCHYFTTYFTGLLALKALWNFGPAKDGGGNVTSKAPSPSSVAPASNPSKVVPGTNTSPTEGEEKA